MQLSSVVVANSHIAGNQKDNISVNTPQTTLLCAAMCGCVQFITFSHAEFQK